MTKILIVLLDELVFRPLVWLIAWTPDKKSRWEEYWTSEEL